MLLVAAFAKERGVGLGGKLGVRVGVLSLSRPIVVIALNSSSNPEVLYYYHAINGSMYTDFTMSLDIIL